MNAKIWISGDRCGLKSWLGNQWLIELLKGQELALSFKAGATNCGPQAESSLSLIFINKALLKHSHIHSTFCIICSYFCAMTAELSSCDSYYIAHWKYSHPDLSQRRFADPFLSRLCVFNGRRWNSYYLRLALYCHFLLNEWNVKLVQNEEWKGGMNAVA